MDSEVLIEMRRAIDRFLVCFVLIFILLYRKSESVPCNHFYFLFVLPNFCLRALPSIFGSISPVLNRSVWYW